MPAKRNVLVSIVFRVIVCTVLLALAFAVVYVLLENRPQPAASDDAGETPRVLVMPARQVPVRRQWEGFGTAQAMDSADIPARVTATVVERPAEIRPGRAVARGDLIVLLDDSEFARQAEMAEQTSKDIDAQLQRLKVEEISWARRTEIAENDARLAREDLERVRQAHASDVARQRELDQAQRALNTAEQTLVATREERDKIAPRRAGLLAQRDSQQAAWRLAKLDVERSRIASPMDGSLQSVDVEVGENIQAGQRVARVVNLARIEVPLLLPATARPYLAAGDQVRLAGSGSSTHFWEAQVTRIAPEDDEATRTVTVYVEVRQDPAGSRPLLAPGKFVEGVVESSDPEMRWVVPRRALSNERIMLIEGGRVASRPIVVDYHVEQSIPETGLPDTQWVVVREPLPDDALVVVDGARALVLGSAARPMLPEEHALEATP